MSLSPPNVPCVKRGSPNGGAGAVTGGGEFVVLGLPVFLTPRHQF